MHFLSVKEVNVCAVVFPNFSNLYHQWSKLGNKWSTLGTCYAH